MSVRDLTFRFIGVDAGAGREFDKMAEKSSLSEKALGGLALGAVAAGATVAAVSIKMAASFQSSMELLHTQAGASQAEVQKMSQAVLSLAGPTATAPEELAAGLYHLESAGLRGQKALDALRIAAEGAKVGQANLEDVTNALNAVIASGIPGAQNISAAMGALNATVGAGDMRMQDLAEAMGTGFLAVVKGFGVTLSDASAALAVFGDNNIRGADAATQLRMAVLFMAQGTKAADKVLRGIGLSTEKLRNDLAQGGLNQALTDLHAHLVANGDTGAKMGDVLLQAFGHKAGTGLSVLVGQFSRFQTKLEEVNKGAGTFGESWKATSQTLSVEWDRLKASSQALFITIGTELLPVATRVMDAFGAISSRVQSAFGSVFSFIHQLTSRNNTVDVKVNQAIVNQRAVGGMTTAIRADAVVPQQESVTKSANAMFAAYDRLAPVVADVKERLDRFGEILRSKVFPAVQSVANVAMAGFHHVINVVSDALHNNRKGLESLFSTLGKIAAFVGAILVPVLKFLVHVVFTQLGFQLRMLITVAGQLGQALADIWKVAQPALRILVEMWLRIVGDLVSGAAKAFGWVPGLGGKLKKAAREFDSFRDQVNAALNGIHDKTINVRVNTAAMKNQVAVGGMTTAIRAGFASGGNPPMDGSLFTTGEHGPELMRYKNGQLEVLSNPQSRHLLSEKGGNTYNITVVNPEREPASDSLPTVMRRLAYTLGL